MRRAFVVLAAALLSACGPSWAPPSAPTTPCDVVSETAYNAAREAGAASARAVVHDNWVDMTTGPGIVHCATYSSTMRPCRRPNDLVIAYEQEGRETFYVLVPANAEYRFNANAAPNTCQIVRPVPGS